MLRRSIIIHSRHLLKRASQLNEGSGRWELAEINYMRLVFREFPKDTSVTTTNALARWALASLRSSGVTVLCKLELQEGVLSWN